jgi:hypothetical protein
MKQRKVDPAARKIVLVGHCGPDAYMLRSAVQRIVPGAMLAMVDDPDELEEHVEAKTVLLINRVLDGGFAGGSGIDLIASLARRQDHPVMMLVSNFEEAQAAAVKVGAKPGFGKSQLYAETTARLLREAAGADDESAPSAR